ncbi:MAG: flippase-like domain-containing protein [Anaerolineales bacterium]|nr:flippase-like domain-containing protein [Anaerolineales bacterium]
MRKFILAVILLLTVGFVLFSFSELENIVEALQASNLWFLAAALAVEAIWMYNMAVTFQNLYQLVGLTESRQRLVLMSTAANFVNVVAPSAGIGGMAVFIDQARQRNQPPGRVTVVGALFLLFDYLAFLCVLALGLTVLFRRHNLNAGELAASAILCMIALAVGLLIYLGYRSEEQLGRVLSWCGRLVNQVARPFIKRDYVQIDRAYVFAAEIAEGVSVVRGKGRQLIWPFLFSLNNKALLLCVLALSFLTWGTPFSIGTLVGGFSIGYLFTIVSPTPAGIGLVEGALPVALGSLRVQWEAASLITLTYRLITFWFPLGVGGLAFRILQGKPKTRMTAPGA